MQNRIRQCSVQHEDKTKEQTKLINSPVFSATIKPTVKESEFHDEGHEDLNTMIADLANANDNMLCSGNADMHQENDTLCFQDEKFIGFLIITPTHDF